MEALKVWMSSGGSPLVGRSGTAVGSINMVSTAGPVPYTILTALTIMDTIRKVMTGRDTTFRATTGAGPAAANRFLTGSVERTESVDRSSLGNQRGNL